MKKARKHKKEAFQPLEPGIEEIEAFDVPLSI